MRTIDLTGRLIERELEKKKLDIGDYAYTLAYDDAERFRGYVTMVMLAGLATSMVGMCVVTPDNAWLCKGLLATVGGSLIVGIALGVRSFVERRSADKNAWAYKLEIDQYLLNNRSYKQSFDINKACYEGYPTIEKNMKKLARQRLANQEREL